MNQDQANKILNKFVDLASSILKQDTYKPRSPSADFITQISSFYRDESTRISLQGRNSYNQIEAFAEQLWNVNREIYQTVSAKTIREKVIDLIFQYQKDEHSIITDSFKKALDELLSLPKQQWLVLRPVYGASLGSNKPSQLGPFTLYTWNDYQLLVASKDISILDSCLQHAHECKELDKSYPSSFPMLENLGNIFISVQVSARDSDRALDLADERFSQFENVISYMLGLEAKSFDFGVINSSGLNVLESLLICSEIVSYSNEFQDNIFPLQLDSPFFIDGKICFNETDHIQYWEDFKYSWIWTALKLESSQLSDWQKRILSAVEWVGKGLRDKNPARSLVQFTFALEALFSYQEKGILVSPSIASTLAEFTAFIIEDNLSARLDTIRMVNRIYSSRSAIAHGGSQIVETSIMLEAMRLMRSLITQILINPELSQFQSIEQVKDWVNKKKYS